MSVWMGITLAARFEGEGGWDVGGKWGGNMHNQQLN